MIHPFVNLFSLTVKYKTMAISDYLEDLIYRVLAGEADEYDQKAFREWMEEREEHRAFFMEIEKAWWHGKYAMKWKNVEASAAWKAVEHRHEKRRWRKIGWFSGIAAAILLMFGGGILLFEGERGVVPLTDNVIRSGSSKAILILPNHGEVFLQGEGMDTIHEAGKNILNMNARIDYSQQDGKDQGMQRTEYHELLIPKGGEYQLCLSDGTTVYMNADSRLRFPVRFQGRTREVFLEGEAYFDVHSDASHPFVVHASELNVRVLGTGFNVMAYKNDSRTEVTLVNGKVEVKGEKINEELKPNQQIVLDKATGMYELKDVNVHTYVDWKNGILNFDAMPLDELCERLSRWYNVTFFFSNENLKKLRFSGAVRKYNEIDYILRLIEATTDVTFNISGTTVVVCKK